LTFLNLNNKYLCYQKKLLAGTLIQNIWKKR